MGTSGSGNHFVEFGEVELLADDPQIGLLKGKYLGILSHSGSRGLVQKSLSIMYVWQPNNVRYPKKPNSLRGSTSRPT